MYVVNIMVTVVKGQGSRVKCVISEQTCVEHSSCMAPSNISQLGRKVPHDIN